MELLKITKKVYHDYTNTVNGNNNEGFMKSRKKLTRNWILGNLINENEEYEWKNYGCLLMCRHKESNRIVNLLNDRVHRYDFNVNKEEKQNLTAALNIW